MGFTGRRRKVAHGAGLVLARLADHRLQGADAALGDGLEHLLLLLLEIRARVGGRFQLRPEPAVVARDNEAVDRHFARLGVGLQLEAFRQEATHHDPHLVERGGTILGLRGDVELVRVLPRRPADDLKGLPVVGGHHQHPEGDVLRRQATECGEHHRHRAQGAGRIRVAWFHRCDFEGLRRRRSRCWRLREQRDARRGENECHRRERGCSHRLSPFRITIAAIIADVQPAMRPTVQRPRRGRPGQDRLRCGRSSGASRGR